ncbi:MAG: hypothetical protein U1E23_03570 [Reyranellaceae bacterium]
MSLCKLQRTHWFRSYADKLDNPKILRLSDSLYRAWDGMLCIACRTGGVLPPLADLALMLRRSPSVTARLVEALVQAGLLVRTERGIEPHDWSDWQYQSDVSTERVKRFRKRQSAATRNVSVTASDTEADTESDREAPPGLPESEVDKPRPVAARGSLEGSAHDRVRRVHFFINQIPK